MRVTAHIGVIAQGCVKEARTKLNVFNSISASHPCAITPGNTHFRREVACYREWFRDTY